jgi:hypothetical protein
MAPSFRTWKRTPSTETIDTSTETPDTSLNADFWKKVGNIIEEERKYLSTEKKTEVETTILTYIKAHGAT